MNCCDYDSLTTYPAGSFSSRYKTDISDCMVETKKEDLGKLSSTFFDQEYRTYKTIKEMILYRVFGLYKKDVNDAKEEPNGAKINGSYASTEFAESIIDAKIRLALDPKWKNLKLYEAKILVPIGETIHVGKVAPVTLKSGTVLEGLADQIILPINWSVNWITGIRRVTARQLQKVPEYLSVTEYEDMLERVSCLNKEDLYKKSCPLCGWEDIEVLSPDKQFDIIGCKGNTYKMQYHCMREKCEYYW